MRRLTCECEDRQCPHCGGSCHCDAATVLYRVDMDDVQGTRFCAECASDAWESGLYTDSDDDDSDDDDSES